MTISGTKHGDVNETSSVDTKLDSIPFHGRYASGFLWLRMILIAVAAIGLVLVNIPFFSSIAFVAAIIVPIGSVLLSIIFLCVLALSVLLWELFLDGLFFDLGEFIHLLRLIPFLIGFVIVIVCLIFELPVLFPIAMTAIFFSYITDYILFGCYLGIFNMLSYNMYFVPLIFVAVCITMSVMLFAWPAAALAVGLAPVSAMLYVTATTFLLVGIVLVQFCLRLRKVQSEIIIRHTSFVTDCNDFLKYSYYYDNNGLYVNTSTVEYAQLVDDGNYGDDGDYGSDGDNAGVVMFTTREAIKMTVPLKSYYVNKYLRGFDKVTKNNVEDIKLRIAN